MRKNLKAYLTQFGLSKSKYFFLNIFQDCRQPSGQEMLSSVRQRGINAHSVSPQPASYIAYPELLVRKLVVSGLAPGPSSDHTAILPEFVTQFVPTRRSIQADANSVSALPDQQI